MRDRLRHLRPSLFVYWDARPFLLTVSVAFIVRVVVGCAIRSVSPLGLFPDEEYFLSEIQEPGSTWLRNHYQTFFLPNRFAYWLFSDSWFGPLVIQALAGALAVAIGLRLVMHVSQSRVALRVSGAILMLAPSQVLWSSVLLREAFVWLFVALTTSLLMASLASIGLQSLVLNVGIWIGLLLVLDIRPLTGVVVLLLALTVALFHIARGKFEYVLAVAVLALLPLAGGYGLFASTFLGHAVGSMEEVRSRLGGGAESSFVGTTTGDITTTTGDITTTTGDITTTTGDITTTTGDITTGLVAFLFRPVLGEPTTSTSSILASLESPFWILLVALAIFGFAVSTKKRILAVPGLYVVGMSVANALSQGNLGTAFRHRGQLLFALVILAAPAIDWIISRWHKARHPASPSF